MHPQFTVSKPRPPPYVFIPKDKSEDKVVCDNFNRDPYVFINKNTIIYGRTGTGKTTIVRDIMKILQPHYPIIFVICPTMSSYDNYVPSAVRMDSLNLKFLREITQRQKDVTTIYNNIQKHRQTIIEKYGTFQEKNAIVQLTNAYEDKKMELTRLYAGSSNQLENALHIIQRNYQARLLRLQREAFENMRRELSAMRVSEWYESLVFRNQSIGKISFDVIRFYDINPKMLLIFDDVTGNFKEYAKIQSIDKSYLFKDIFTKGRHINITTIMTCHSDTSLPPDIRGAVHINIFSYRDIVEPFFKRTNNMLINACNASSFFKEEIFKNEHYKMIYDRDLSIFYAYRAQIHPVFRMGSRELWQLAHISDEENV